MAKRQTKRQIQAAAKKAKETAAEQPVTANDPKRSKSGLVSASNLGKAPVQTKTSKLIQVSDL